MKEYTLEDYIVERCNKDSEFKEIWDSEEDDRNLIISIIRAREGLNMSFLDRKGRK